MIYTTGTIAINGNTLARSLLRIDGVLEVLYDTNKTW
jgi:hypothetical protein